MAWSPWLHPGEFQPTKGGAGIFPSWYGGWRTSSGQRFVGDTTYLESRVGNVWSAAVAGANTLDGSFASWGFSANATPDYTVIPGDGVYNASALQARQIIRLAAGEDLIDAMIDEWFVNFVSVDHGFVKGVHYDTPPAGAQYKGFDWIPDPDGAAEMLPGGRLGLGVWAGNALSNETAGYYGVDLEIRDWQKNIPVLPDVAAQVPEGTNFESLGAAEQGGWPGHEALGDVLFSWPGFYPVLTSGDVGSAGQWSDDDVTHDVDLFDLADHGGLIKLAFTSDLFAAAATPPPYLPGETLTDGGNMTVLGGNWRQQSLNLRLIARAYPLMRLPRIKFWVTDPLLLRWLNHMSPLVWQWLLQDAWLSIRLSMTQSYY